MMTQYINSWKILTSETNVSCNNRTLDFTVKLLLESVQGPHGRSDEGKFTGSDWNMSSDNSEAAGHPSDNMVSLYMKTTKTQSQWCEANELRFNNNHPAGSVQPASPIKARRVTVAKNSCKAFQHTSLVKQLPTRLLSRVVKSFLGLLKIRYLKDRFHQQRYHLRFNYLLLVTLNLWRK